MEDVNSDRNWWKKIIKQNDKSSVAQKISPYLIFRKWGILYCEVIFPFLILKVNLRFTAEGTAPSELIDQIINRRQSLLYRCLLCSRRARSHKHRRSRKRSGLKAKFKNYLFWMFLHIKIASSRFMIHSIWLVNSSGPWITVKISTLALILSMVCRQVWNLYVTY